MYQWHEENKIKWNKLDGTLNPAVENSNQEPSTGILLPLRRAPVKKVFDHSNQLSSLWASMWLWDEPIRVVKVTNFLPISAISTLFHHLKSASSDTSWHGCRWIMGPMTYSNYPSTQQTCWAPEQGPDNSPPLLDHIPKYSPFQPTVRFHKLSAAIPRVYRPKSTLITICNTG